MTSDREKKEAGKGFSGLSSQVSEVDSAVEHSKREAAHISVGPAAPQITATAEQASGGDKPRADDQRGQHRNSKPSSGSSAGTWLLAIGLTIVIYWLLSLGFGGDRTSSTPKASSTVPVAPTISELPISSPARSPQAEVRPPVGTNNVLDNAQIRYCLSEKIRIDAANIVVSRYVTTDVNRYNAMVEDYNSRCGYFRYRRGSLESVRQEVERARPFLEADGRGRFLAGS